MREPFKVPSYIRRTAGAKVSGWQAYPPGRRSKLFSDSKFSGGQHEALHAAIEYVQGPRRRLIEKTLRDLLARARTGYSLDLDVEVSRVRREIEMLYVAPPVPRERQRRRRPRGLMNALEPRA